MKIIDNGYKVINVPQLNTHITTHNFTKYLTSIEDLDYQISTDASKIYRLTKTATYTLNDMLLKATTDNGGHINIKDLGGKSESKNIKKYNTNTTSSSYLNGIKALKKNNLLDKDGYLAFNPLLDLNHVSVYFNNGWKRMYITYVLVSENFSHQYINKSNNTSNFNHKLINFKLAKQKYLKA